MTTAVELRGVEITQRGAVSPVLRDVDLLVDEGEMLVVTGPTGAGKTTLLATMCGLVPHLTGATLAGHVTVAGLDTRDLRPRDLTEFVGWVGQDPRAGFVTDTVTDEIVYVMENLGYPPRRMRRRLEETLDLLGIVDLRDRPLDTLSGGEAQRVAIASVLAASPRVLILDEPTSALDPAGADDVLAALNRLVHDVGLTVIASEHRLERIVHLADRIAVVDAARVFVDQPAAAMAVSPIVPPVVELGRRLGWQPVPLSIREARRSAGQLRERLAAGPEPSLRAPDTAVRQDRSGGPAPTAPTAPTVVTNRLDVGRAGRAILERLDLELEPGSVTCLMGRNGAGKTTLLRCLVGLDEPLSGTVRVLEQEPSTVTPASRVALIGMVPQDPDLLLYCATVAEECATADRDGGLEPGATADALQRLGFTLDPRHHPRDLSAGQRMGLAIAVVVAHEPAVLLLDEPTRGLDYGAKRRLVEVLEGQSAQGRTVMCATHDVELAAVVADRVVVLGGGREIASGPPTDVLCDSVSFAPQVAKVFAPVSVLTVGAAIDALERCPVEVAT